MRASVVSAALVGVAHATYYCPSAQDLVGAYGQNVRLNDRGWTIKGDGGAATKAAFNLNGGYVEYDMDVSAAQSGVIPNVYTISPSYIGPTTGFHSGNYCHAQVDNTTWCMEVDWIEANGGCGGQSAIHTVPGTSPKANDANGCTSWGCQSTYRFSSSSKKFRMRIDYDDAGHYLITRNGEPVGNYIPAARNGDFDTIRATHESKGAVIYSSQWTGEWVPLPSECGKGPGNLEGSTFSISNLVIAGTLKQGPEPTKCSGPQPGPMPVPTPVPAPVPPPTPPSPAPAYTKVCSDCLCSPRIQIGTEYWSDDASLENCEKLCTADSNCAHLNYFPRTTNCFHCGVGWSQSASSSGAMVYAKSTTSFDVV